MMDLRNSRKATQITGGRLGRCAHCSTRAAQVAGAEGPDRCATLAARAGADASSSASRVACPADGRIPAICPGFGRKLDSRAWGISSLRVALPLLWSAASTPVYTWRTNMDNTDLTLTILQNIQA